jgi:hypothetical protein
MPRKILILGASYGSLLGVKLALASQDVKLVCLPQEASVINAEGAVVRMPSSAFSLRSELRRGPSQGPKESPALIEVNSRDLPGHLSAHGPFEVNPRDFDLVCLAMQEPQYRSPGVRELLRDIAGARVPCMSIMNMPPLPYLSRIPGISPEQCAGSYTDASVWSGFDPEVMTLCSPDPQAFRPPGERANVLQVRLPTNFKVARFDADSHTKMLNELADAIESSRYAFKGEKVDLPVKLKVHDSVFVPLAKWAMLLTGNYRCVRTDGVVPIREAVHGNLAESRDIYEWVVDLCISLGAAAQDMVPFKRYAGAALSLGTPSSAARALAAGVPNIERVDRLVQAVAAQRGSRNALVDRGVEVVDEWLERNRRKAASYA